MRLRKSYHNCVASGQAITFGLAEQNFAPVFERPAESGPTRDLLQDANVQRQNDGVRNGFHNNDFHPSQINANVGVIMPERRGHDQSLVQQHGFMRS